MPTKSKRDKTPILMFPPNSAILIFDKTEQKYDLACAMKATAMAGILWDMTEWLRGKLHHGHNFATPGDALEACQAALRDQIDSEGVYSTIFHEQ